MNVVTTRSQKLFIDDLLDDEVKEIEGEKVREINNFDHLSYYSHIF